MGVEERGVEGEEREREREREIRPRRVRGGSASICRERGAPVIYCSSRLCFICYLPGRLPRLDCQPT